MRSVPLVRELKQFIECYRSIEQVDDSDQRMRRRLSRPVRERRTMKCTCLAIGRDVDAPFAAYDDALKSPRPRVNAGTVRGSCVSAPSAPSVPAPANRGARRGSSELWHCAWKRELLLECLGRLPILADHDGGRFKVREH